MDRLAWCAVGLLAAATLAMPIGIFPAGLHTALYDAVAVATVVLAFGGLVRHRPRRPAGWVLVLAGFGGWVLGDLVYSLEQHVWRLESYPVPSDAVFLGSYVLLGTGILAFVRSRRAGRDATAVLDALVIAGGAGVLAGVFVVAPLAADSGLSTFGKLVVSSYPLADLLLLATLVRLWASPGARTASFHCLAASLGLVLVADAMWNVSVVTTGDTGSTPLNDSLWLAGYVLVCAAAWVPSMTRLVEPVRVVKQVPLTRARLGILGAGLVLPGAALLLEGLLHGEVSWPLIGTGSVLLSVLVLARLMGLLTLLRAQALRLTALAARNAAENEQTNASLSLQRATLESTADGILVVGSSGEVAGHNEKFRRMWRIPADLMASGEDERIMSSVLEQLTDPEAFVAEVQRLYDSPTESSLDVLHFSDGRVFERYSQPQILDDRAVGRVWSFRDVTSYHRLQDELRRQAFTDELTGLPNRHMVMEKLTRALSGSPAPQNPALLLLDVDDFKTINDSLGHQAGDQLLAKVADRLGACVREGDLVGRLGGDEFVLLLESVTDAQELPLLAERILQALAEPMYLGARRVMPRASIGIAVAGPDVAAEDLLRNADLAMYTAKRNGGATYCLYACEMHSEVLSKLELQADLAHAIEHGELSVVYQPVVNVQSLRTECFEALVRWHHPERGPVSPVEFIPLAEETGLIDSIGRWVLSQACAQARHWEGLGHPGQPIVSVNVSPHQLSNPGLVDEVRNVLADTGLPGTALCLEITESALERPGVDVISVLSAIKDLGVHLALDDFGTGYSSLGRIDQYPLDIVKIDRSFVHRLSQSGSSALVEAVLRLADGLGLNVIAEGIETEEQLQTLTELGCQKVQGYLLAAPTSPEQARKLLTSPTRTRLSRVS